MHPMEAIVLTEGRAGKILLHEARIVPTGSVVHAYDELSFKAMLMADVNSFLCSSCCVLIS